MGLIESQDMVGFINSELTLPDRRITVSSTDDATEKMGINNPRYLAWRCSIRLLHRWITGILSEEILGLVVGLDTTFDVWNTLTQAVARQHGLVGCVGLWRIS